jgi:predicted dehydrogenase
MREVRFGIIGCGLMGREFAVAAARWLQLRDMDVRPVIIAVCDANPAAMTWFREHIASLRFATTEYQELLARSDVEAVYCAVPHHLHERFYIDIVDAGKHLFGEKPFGINREANRNILDAVERHPELLVRCSSEMPFFPGAVRIIAALRAGRFGRIIEAEAGLLHSSDLDPEKPINWKRTVASNGEYGCLGDLGMHALHVPLRFGWVPAEPRALLSNIMTERPDGRGNRVPCETWDNGTIFGEVALDGYTFPLVLHTKRIAPGERNTWFLKVHGTQLSMEFSTKHPKTLRVLEYEAGGEQAWQHVDLGSQSAYPTHTGEIFEFGLSDAILQMWAAFCDELAHGRAGMRQPFHCVTPEETRLHHEVLTAALESSRRSTVEARAGPAAIV